jgi:hypothetical protein
MSIELFAGMLFLGVFAVILTGLMGLLSCFWHMLILPSLHHFRRRQQKEDGRSAGAVR